MKRRLSLAVLLVCAAPLVAQAPAPMVVDAQWLRAHIADRNLVLLHVGPRPSYDTAHIAGAQFIGTMEIGRNDGGRTLELPLPATLDSTLEAKGISDDSRIIVYSSDGWGSPSTRVLLTLVWAGLGERVSLLDGGLRAWRAAGGAVTADSTRTPARGRLTLAPRSDVIVTADWLAANRERPGIALIDARNERFYLGNYPPPPPNAPANQQDPRPGHITGAFSLPFTSMTDSTGRMRPVTVLRELFASAGAAPGETVVAYCHIGQQATMVWFAARLAGYDVRLYDGSFTEWSRLSGPQYPVTRP
jgi:thiosulfate/3-mercaptopyruvate sulfurtransferase